MKSTSKMMVITAVFLVAAALLVMPASAERNIGAGGTFFAYEENNNLNFAELNASVYPALGEDLKFLTKYEEDNPEKGQVNQFELAKQADGSFRIITDLTTYDYDATDFGTYFAEGDSQESTTKVYLREPKLTLDVVLDNDRSSSIAGKTVTQNTKIAFKIGSGKVGTNYRDGADFAQAKIELKTPGGAVLYQIGDVKLNKIDLDASTIFVGGNADLRDLTTDTYTVRAVWDSPAGFSDYAADSNEATFTVGTVDVSIESNKENVIRNNPFTITIRGDSKKTYFVYIKDAAISSAKYPILKSGQNGVTIVDTFVGGKDANAAAMANRERAKVAGTFANVSTTAGGTRSIEFATNSSTDDRSFTIKIVDPDDASKDDDVKVKVEEGEVTITAEGAGTYYLGEEIKLSGTNTDSKDVYLFVTGPNLGDENGVSLDDVTARASQGNYVHRQVESDDTWEYRWDTSNIGGVIDSGTYTVYAVSADVDDDGFNVDKKNLKGVKYQTIGVYLKKPFLTLDDVASRVARGDELKVTGVAEGNPDNVKVWIFGKNYRDLGVSETVEDDGTFEYTLERDTTEDLATGQYFLVVQHPMTDGVFNVRPATQAEIDDAVAAGRLSNPTQYVIRDATGNLIDLGKLPASEAATALIDALNSPNCDDTYAKVSFQIEEAFIGINAIGDQSIGTKFTISGTTNLAVGNDLNIDVSGASFKPTEKTQASGFSAASGQVKVEAGDDYNKWSYEVDAADFKADQYTVSVESVDADVSTSATFNVLEGPVTPTETVTPVEPTTTAPVQTTTTAPVEPTATPTPGFGALVALIGLGAVAFLVMRRH